MPAVTHDLNDPFAQWLSAIVRHPDWNGKRRTPKQWRKLYDAGMTPEQAATTSTTS